MDIFSQSKDLMQSITPFIKKLIEENTRECLRTYKARIVKAPDISTGKCEVKLTGENSILSLPYSSAVIGASVGDIVWVLTTYNSWKNAIVWEKIGFSSSKMIGSIYITLDPTPPHELFGGVWELLENRVLMGAGDTYSVGETGGSSTHTLTIEEMPAHKHRLTGRSWAQHTDSPSDLDGLSMIPNTTSVESSLDGVSTSVGGNKAFDILPPYVAVYIWNRVA